MAFFSSGGSWYLAFARFSEKIDPGVGGNDRYDINSEILVWNSATARFDAFQSIPTHGAAGWAYFEMESAAADVRLLAVANQRSGSTPTPNFSTTSNVFVWNGCNF